MNLRGLVFISGMVKHFESITKGWIHIHTHPPRPLFQRQYFMLVSGQLESRVSVDCILSGNDCANEEHLNLKSLFISLPMFNFHWETGENTEFIQFIYMCV